MSKNNINIGDLILCLKSSRLYGEEGGYKKGKIYKVTGFSSDNINSLDSEGNPNGWHRKNFVKINNINSDKEFLLALYGKN